MNNSYKHIFPIIFILFSFSIIKSYSQQISLDSLYRLNSGLIEASYEGNEKEVISLILKGADVNARTYDSITPLMYAAQGGFTDIVKILIHNGADVNARPQSGKTALITACREGKLEIAEILIRNGAETNCKDKEGFCPLLYSSGYGDYFMTDMLIYYDADISCTSKEGINALIAAASEGHTEIVNLLISKGININSTDKNGFTALHYAAQNGWEETVNALLASKAGPDIKNNSNVTPLILATINNHPVIIDSLAEHGARLSDAFSEKGKITPLKIAKIYKLKEAKTALISHGAKDNLIPAFTSVSTGGEIFFNHKDIFSGLKASLCEERYNASIDIGIYSRIGRKKVLDKYISETYFQYYESRFIVTAGINKDFMLKNTGLYKNYGLFTSANAALTFGFYKATTRKPGTKIIPLFKGGLYKSGRIFTIRGGLQYIDFNIYKEPAYMIYSGLTFKIPARRSMNIYKLNKYINWL